MANPNRTPLAILKARGSSHAFGRTDAPVVEGPLEPPVWMSEAARPYWDWIIAHAHPHVLAACDAGHIQLTAESWEMYQRANSVVLEKGFTGGSGIGTEYQRTEVGVRNKMWAQVVSGLSKLGMNPSDRSNVSAAPDAAKGKVGKFIGIA